jgi:hypothetical protein
MKRLKYFLTMLLALGFIATAAVLQGRLSNRWGAHDALTASGVGVIEQMPREFGDWRFQEDQPLSRTVQAVLQCVSHLNHVFVNKSTGETIGSTVILGPSGPLIVHTPEICLSSVDYAQVGPSQRVVVKQGDQALGTFYRAIFRSKSPNLPSMEIFWGWNDGTGWSAPDNPRLSFGGAPALYRLQIAAQLWPNVAEGDEGSVAQFLRAYLVAAPQFQIAK